MSNFFAFFSHIIYNIEAGIIIILFSNIFAINSLLNYHKGETMLKIFISHAYEDNPIARKLSKQLRQDGAETWLYYTQVEVGDRLPDFFKEAIEWCDTFLLLWSKEAANSYNVTLECRRAFVLNKKIIVCRFDETEQTIGLYKSLVINFFNFEKGYKNLIQTLDLTIQDEPADKKINNTVENEAESVLQIMRFRRQAKKLSESDVEMMIKKYNFFDVKRNENGRGIKKQFESQDIKGEKVIFDAATGLMWQRGGSSYSMWYNEAENWIKELNDCNYAGYNDWRFPTLEEAMSLMNYESKKNGLYIDPVFDNIQLWIWTSDLSENASRVWVVFFNYGSCYVNCFDFNNYVRAVRSEN